MLSLECSIASASQAAAVLRAAGFNRMADLVGARLYDLAGCHIDMRDEAAVWAAIEADGLDCVPVIHYESGGNTTLADDRETVLVFTFGWGEPAPAYPHRQQRRTLHACVPEPEEES